MAIPVTKRVPNCRNCFADGLDECLILESRITNKECPFKKTKSQFYADQCMAGLRLANLYKRGLFNPNALVNLKEQAMNEIRLVSKK